MNERIQELKRQAVAEADVSHIDFDNLSHTDIQILGDIAVEKKFAELIVLESVQAIQDFVDHRIPASEYPVRLKEHFGFESEIDTQLRNRSTYFGNNP